MTKQQSDTDVSRLRIKLSTPSKDRLQLDSDVVQSRPQFTDGQDTQGHMRLGEGQGNITDLIPNHIRLQVANW